MSFPKHGSWFAVDRNWCILVALYLGALLSANAMAAKLVSVAGVATVTVGALAIPLVYTTTDLLNELYGRAVTRMVVWMGLCANIVLVCYSLVLGVLPASRNGAEFDVMFGVTWRVVLGSQSAYLVSSMIDIDIFTLVRRATKGRHLWLRQSCAVGVAQLVDSSIFILIAFAGVVPGRTIISLILAEYALKIVLSPARTALSYVVLPLLRRRS